MPLDLEDVSPGDDDFNGTNENGNQTQTSTDLACEVCGTPLVYAGTGRKPKRCDEHKRSGKASSAGPSVSRSGAGRGSASVEQAVSTLGNLYDGVGLLFLFTSPAAAQQWTEGVPELQTRNRQILSGDPDLTRSINRLGVKGGKFAFAAAQMWAITPPAMLAIAETRMRAAQRAAEREAQEESSAQERREQMRVNNSGQFGTTGTEPPNASFFG